MWGDKLQSIIEPSYGIRLIKAKNESSKNGYWKILK